MKRHRSFWIPLALMFLIGTALAGVKTDWDQSANFSNYKTFAWGKGTPAKNPLMDQRIVEGVNKRLADKNFLRVEPNNNPDLIVLYHAASGQQTQLNTTSTGGWGWYWGGGMSTTTVNTIPVGQLTVDIGDAKTNKLLWMGSASDTLSNDPQKNQKKLESALDKMFKNFPPQPKK